MTRTAFLAALEQLLAPLPEAERKDALSYYEDYLDAAGPEKEARAIAELGSPEEVARKILDEQTPAGSSAAPASPSPRSRWRMVLGGGLAVLVLVCFFFQHSKATPVQPVEPASPAADSSSVPEESNGTHLAVPADTVPLPIPADDLGESTLQIPWKAAYRAELELDYGSVVFVTDPTLTSDIYATFQFDNFPIPLSSAPLMNMGTPPWILRCQITGRCPRCPGSPAYRHPPGRRPHPVDLRFGGGDVHLDDLQLQSLKVELDNGSLYADDLTVTRDLEADISIGGCLIRQLSGTKQANISAYRSIHLCLDGDPADYTIDARTDNVVRIGSKNTTNAIPLPVPRGSGPVCHGPH